MPKSKSKIYTKKDGSITTVVGTTYTNEEAKENGLQDLFDAVFNSFSTAFRTLEHTEDPGATPTKDMDNVRQVFKSLEDASENALPLRKNTEKERK